MATHGCLNQTQVVDPAYRLTSVFQPSSYLYLCSFWTAAFPSCTANPSNQVQTAPIVGASLSTSWRLISEKNTASPNHSNTLTHWISSAMWKCLIGTQARVTWLCSSRRFFICFSSGWQWWTPGCTLICCFSSQRQTFTDHHVSHGDFNNNSWTIKRWYSSVLLPERQLAAHSLYLMCCTLSFK